MAGFLFLLMASVIVGVFLLQHFPASTNEPQETKVVQGRVGEDEDTERGSSEKRDRQKSSSSSRSARAGGSKENGIRPTTKDAVAPSSTKTDGTPLQVVPPIPETTKPQEKLVPANGEANTNLTFSLGGLKKKPAPGDNLTFSLDGAKKPAPAVPSDLVDILRAKTATVTVSRALLHEVTVTVEFPEKSDKIPTEVHVPIGTYFRCDDHTYQNLIVVQPIKVPVEGNRSLILKIPTCCTNRAKHAPNLPNYTLERLPLDNVMVRFVQQQIDSPYPTRFLQMDLWNFTDKNRIRD
jgi:hypothetical protein